MNTSSSAGVLAALFALGLFWCGIGSASHQRAFMLGATTGLVAAILTTLIVFSSSMVHQPSVGDTPAPGAEGLRPGAVGASIGFVVGASIAGALLASLGSVLVKGPAWLIHARATWTARTTPKRMIIVLAGALVPLIATGSLVTSTRSGLAIADWPRSDSAYMFFYPLSLMAQPNIYFEHTHRLFGMLIGIAAIFAVAYIWLGDASKKARIGVTVALVLISIQGYIGGNRVEEKSQILAVVHGVLAQLIFALVFTCIVWQTTLYRSSSTLHAHPRDRKIKLFGMGFLHASILQLILGATFRHMKASGSTAANHALWTHLGFSAIVVLFGVAAGAMLISRSDTEKDEFEPTARRLGWFSIAVVSLQIVLGFMALFAVMRTLGKPDENVIPNAEDVATMSQVPWSRALTTAAHQFNGALVLAAAAMACVWGRWLKRHTSSASQT
ncbi:MAG: COX15/CtaA family protein [Phycisphaeraceae bacterium]|nr:COX15/CtaA family protein [Phycisphaerales bacterium]MCB9859178.1 COX15/CtaA family protein [Phycisphaeraceae bacterium]